MADGSAATRPVAARLFLWWATLFALWLLLVGEWTGLVAIWGAGLSLAAVVGAEVVTRQGMLAVRGRWGWLPELASAAKSVVIDFGVLTGTLVTAIVRGQRRVGLFREDRSVEGKGRLATGRRAWVALVATWSPNCYVIDIDPDTGRRMVHDLRPLRSSEQPA